MNERELQELTEEIGISAPSASSLGREIRKELNGLQAEPSTADQTTRRQALTDALRRLQSSSDSAEPSSQVVAMSPAQLTDLVRAASSGKTEDPPEEKLRTGVQVAATQARKDFRVARTLPFAGFGALLVFVWSQREAFGVDFTGAGAAVFGALAASIVTLGFMGYAAAWRAQRRDERTLKLLYRAEYHAAAISFAGDGGVFHVRRFQDALRDVAGMGERPSVLSMLSTVDLDGALEDATHLAIDRFVKLGVIEPVATWSGLDYRATGGSFRGKQ